MADVTLIGNCTRAPELRYLASGQAVANFAIAVNRRWKDPSGAQKESVSFFDVVAYGSLGENVADSIDKGARLVVAGRLDQRSWQTDEGQKRTKVEVVADAIGPDLRWATCTVKRTPAANGAAHVPAGVGASDGEEPF